MIHNQIIFNDKCVPLSFVRMMPVYSGKDKNGLDKSLGWFVQVDFAGVGVPKMRVRGGCVHEYSVEEASKIYSGKYRFVTRVEYHFKHRLLNNAYKNVCRFNTDVAKRIKKNNKKIKSVRDLWGLARPSHPQIAAAKVNENTK